MSIPRDKKGKFVKGNSFWLGKQRSEETKNKISQSLKGSKPNNGSFKKGITPWNKGKKGVMPEPWNKGKKTGIKPWLGKKRSKEDKEKMRLAKLGKKHTEEAIEKMREAHKGKSNSGQFKKGLIPWNWFADRSKLKQRQERNDPAYFEWRLSVYKRDNYKCRISNCDCGGRIIAHHILPWRDFPELRYEVNNGITLCQAHHPRKRAEEKRLIPFFQGLMPVSKEEFV